MNLEQALQSLNKEQQLAAETIEGPVMVIAGPGTGKTQVLATRIANILTKTDTNPSNILCLTFTESGTVAMKNRLIEFIGPTGHDVKIATFHGFCNEVIQENSDYFGVREMESIDELERVKILKSIIDSFDKDNPLKRYKSATYYDIGNLKSLFSTMRKENLTYEIITKKVEEHLEYIRNDESMYYKRKSGKFQKGDFNINKFNLEKAKYDKLIAGAAEFETYLKITKEKGFYDFDDMILWVKNAFQKNDFILKRYQEKYQYILVDEYQDTNGSQNEIVHLLADYFENPNLFVVGDDDQSIYRFQGANTENILEFQERYKPYLHTIALTNNYRSSQGILNAAKSLIDLNENRIISGEDKMLQSGLEDKLHDLGKPKILEFRNTIEENTYICHEILKKQPSGAKLSEIAVIYRSHQDAEYMIDFLTKNNIPVNASKPVDILKEPLIGQILHLLKFFQSELEQPYSEDTELFKVLIQPWFGLDNLTISNFSYWARVEWRKWIYEKHPDKHRRYHWRYLLNNLHEGSHFLSIDQISDLKKVSDRLEELLSKSTEYTLPQYVELILDKCGVLEYIMQTKNKIWNLEAYRSFFDFIKSETRKNPFLDLNRLFELLDTMRQESISIKLNKTLIDKDGVNFLTAHASKGLEFETVYMINCTDKSWNKKGRRMGFSFPPNLVGKEANEEEIEEEESRRLFYVGMTRAKSSLNISYSLEDDQERSQVASKFVDELLSSNLDIVEKVNQEVDPEQSSTFEATLFTTASKPVNLIPTDWINDVLQDYHLSSTDLNLYLECPVSFYYEKILRIPAAKHASLALGSAAHEAIEHYIKESKDQKRGLEKEEFLDLYAKALTKQKDSLTKLEFENYLEYGKIFLAAYFDLKIIHYDLPKIIPELNVKARIGDETMIKGMIDRVEEYPNHISVFDYKTGKHYRDKFKKPGDEKTKDEKILKYGGDYWRQAVFYGLLLENSPKFLNQNIKQVVFEFLESANEDKYKEEVVEITLDDKVFVDKLSQEVFGKIKNHEFSEGCKKEDCKWCNLDTKDI